MSGITGDVKKLFNFKYKSRNDSITDQFCRVLMMKAMLVAAFLTGMNWYKDEIKCIIPGTAGDGVKSFAPQSCWINGFYIYKELKENQNFQGYFGIPNTLEHNGTLEDLSTCVATPGSNICKPLTKLFYLQFQWFPFYLAGLALLYYAPYILFRAVNNDLMNLKNIIKSQSLDVDGVVKGFFNRTVNTPVRQNTKILLNVVVKVCYILVNIVAFTFTDSLLNGDFASFGSNWFDWSDLPHEDRYNYVGYRKFTRAGEVLLPTFGFCDVLEGGMDIKHKLYNKHRFVCEISQHVLYHYVLIALWILLIAGIVLSVVGLIMLLISYVLTVQTMAHEEVAAKEVYEKCSIREREYLNFICKKNVPFYGQLIRKLRAEGDQPLLRDDNCEDCLKEDIAMATLS